MMEDPNPRTEVQFEDIRQLYGDIQRLAASFGAAAETGIPTKPNLPRLTEKQQAVLDILLGRKGHDAIIGPVLLTILQEQGVYMDQSYLTGKVMPVLKQHFEVENVPRVGYFIPEGARIRRA